MSVHLVHGADDALVADKVAEIVRELVGDQDRALVLEEFEGDFVMAGATEAASTPPFFTERRVVVIDRGGSMAADDVGVLVDYLGDPPDFTDLVIVWGSGRVPDALKKAVTGNGGRVIDPSPPTRAADRREWWSEQIRVRELDIEPAAQAMLIEWLGEDASRLDGLVRTLKATYGTKRVSVDMLRPYLGERGDVLPWDLTDAIDGGRAADALRAARRMMKAGERHPLQILAQLHNHYGRLAKLDGEDLSTKESIEAAVGVKGYPAQKAFNTYRAIGHDGVRRAFELLSTADADLRGGTGLDEDVVMDVLIARLARLSPTVSRRN
ncbi:MAG: DNA polymerase III subunit delta [Ilumatobacteraceae bacterium]|jgi:DNA polymerase-3 subunit delta